MIYKANDGQLCTVQDSYVLLQANTLHCKVHGRLLALHNRKESHQKKAKGGINIDKNEVLLWDNTFTSIRTALWSSMTNDESFI